MKSSACRGLEVSDFNLEDEPSDKYLEKFRNPVAAAPVSNTSARQTDAPCTDVDEVGEYHSQDNCLSINSSGTSREDNATKQSTAKISSSLQFDSLGDVPHNHGRLSNKKCRNSFSESDILITSPLASSARRSQMHSALSESPPNEECADVNSDVDESMNEQVSSLASDEDEVSLDGQARNDQISSLLVSFNEGLVIFPEYAIYRGDFYTEPVLAFSEGGVKFKGSAANLEGTSITVECAMDDIVNISGQWLPKVETVVIKMLVVFKDAVQIDNVHETSGAEELKFVVVDTNWFGKQEIIRAMNEKYADVWDVVIDADREISIIDLWGMKSYFPSFDETFKDLVYPKGDSDAICISKRDVDLLQPEIFINDTIIDFYINYLKNQIPQDEGQRFYFFNSFFFRKLADLDKDPNSAADGRAAFLRVRKWTRKVNLFEKDYSFIPVNYSLHWSLIVICHPGEVANVGDEDLLKSAKVPCILHMDSIRGTHSGLKNIIQSYLWEEWKEKGNVISEKISERFASIRFVHLEVPQQENSYDCGLFLLHNLELFLTQAPPTFNPFNISKFSRFLTPDWFPPVEASLKRTVIQNLIRELLIGDRNVSSSSDEDHSSENDDTKIENEFGGASLPEACGSALAYRSIPQSSSSIEISLFPEAENPQSTNNESNLVLREFFESEPAAGSFLQSCDHQPSYYTLNNNPVSAVEVGSNEGLVIFPEYAIYRGDYYTEPVLAFSEGGVKFKGSAANLEGTSITIECAMDDIVNISGQWLPKVETVVIKMLVVFKDAVQIDNVHETSGAEELKFVVVDANWFGKQEIIRALNGKYADVWDVVIDADREISIINLWGMKSYFPSFDETFEDLVYPKGDSDAICISKRDVDLLQPEIFINDTIIDFYINYLKNQIPLEERQRFYFFNSFFFRKLADLDMDPSSAADGRAAFLRVRKWTRKVNLFEKDYSFIPVNYSLHWSLIVICHPGEVANVGDKDLLKSAKVPCILHMDSIRGTHSGLKNLIQRYLWEEWKEKGNDTSEKISERFANMRFVHLEVPQQENSYDCGLFLLHNLELFLTQAPPTFNPFNISKFSRFLTPDWFPPVEASLKRTVIQNLIRELLIGDRNVSSSSDEDHEVHSSENDDTEIENEFGGASLPETCGSALAYRSTPQSSSSIEISLLPEAENPQSTNNESNLVLREFFESEPAAGSFLQSCDHQPSYYTLNNNPVLAVEADDVEVGSAVAPQSSLGLENVKDKVVADSQETSPRASDSSPDITIYEITNDKELAVENLEHFGKTETACCSADVVLERVDEVEKEMMQKSKEQVALVSCDIDNEGKLEEDPLETEDVFKIMNLMEYNKLETVTDTVNGEAKEAEHVIHQQNPIMPLHQEGKNEDITTEDLSSKRHVSDTTVVVDPEEPDAKRRRLLEDNDLHL